MIVGAGPAGLAAGLTAMHLGLRYEILEQANSGGTILQYPLRKIVLTSPVDLPLWGRLKLRETTKESLLELWVQIIAETRLAISTGEKVTDIRVQSSKFKVPRTRVDRPESDEATVAGGGSFPDDTAGQLAENRREPQ